MKIKLLFILILAILITLGCARNSVLQEFPVVDKGELVIFPDEYDVKPDLPSPVSTVDFREFILVSLGNGRFSYLDVTPENGDERDYKKGLYGKGNQMKPNKEDFPHFASYVLH